MLILLLERRMWKSHALILVDDIAIITPQFYLLVASFYPLISLTLAIIILNSPTALINVYLRILLYLAVFAI